MHSDLPLNGRSLDVRLLAGFHCVLGRSGREQGLHRALSYSALLQIDIALIMLAGPMKDYPKSFASMF